MLDLIFSLRQEMASFENLGIDYEEKAFYDGLITVKEQSGFEFPDGENLELAKDIKAIVDDKTSKPNIIVKLAEFGYSPVTMEAVYKNVLEYADNFKRNRS